MSDLRVGVAVIDTGIFRHNDFDNRIVAFADFVNQKINAYDDSGHGTHVSGIIAGSGKASRGKYRGVAPKSAIIAVKVLDKRGNGRVENVIAGLDWVLRMKKIYNIRIVNISFGTTSKKDKDMEKTLIAKVEQLWDAGIVIVVAAGNSGPERNSVTTPGNSKKVITVGSFDDSSYRINGPIRYYSGRGPIGEAVIKPEVVVTGANIVACSNHQNSYSIKSGTSMSAPIVSGAVARLLEIHPDLTPDDVKNRLKKFCVKIDIPENQQGWGMLDVAGFAGGK
ncbi:MAG: S8 family peptidase [Lachnospira sp.]